MTELIAPISEVTVYAGQALITRAGSLELEAGEQELLVTDLMPFNRESLRVAGRGPEGSRILDVETVSAYHSQPPEAEWIELQAAIELLQHRVDLLNSRKDALEDRRQWLRTLGEHSREFAKGLAAGQMKAEDCADFFAFTANQALQNAEAGQDLDVQIKQLTLELQAKRRELNEKVSQKHPDRLTIKVMVELPVTGEFALELSYLVTQASWSPQYDARVSLAEDGNSGEVDMNYLGLVRNSTGEDWQGVSLSLSTARPGQAAQLPELQPHYLRMVEPAMMPAGASSFAAPAAMPLRLQQTSKPIGAKTSKLRERLDEPEDVLLMESAPAPLPPPASQAVAVTQQSGTAYVFKIARPVDIPSGNEPRKTLVARDNLPCEIDYVCAPAVNPVVHLRARVNNTTGRTLLPGTCNIFLSGEFVGTTQIKTLTSPREQFKIFLGIDDSIKVKYEQIEQGVEKGALLQGDIRRLTYGYRITIHNYAAYTRSLVLRSQLPLSKHERIKVKLLSIVPQPTERTKLELLTWRFPLNVDAEVKLEYRYTVEHPQDARVMGLP